METNITDNTTTFPWPSVAQPVNEGQLFHLEYLGYEGPAPKTFREADALIEDLLLTQPVEENVKTYDEDDEDFGDGHSIAEHEYARMMRLRWKEEQKQW